MDTKKLNARKAEKLNAERQEKIAELSNNLSDDGRFGRIFEIECARALSSKTSVSAQGRIDVRVKFETAHGYDYIACECKTNGGRIDDLLNGSNKSKFVIYRLDFIQKHKAGKTTSAWEEHRHINPVIIPTSLFCTVLRQLNAVKEVRHDGKVDGIAIQPSSKKWYEWLCNYPVEFHNDWTYTAEDFEGLGV